MEILKEFSKKHKETLDTVKGIIEKTKNINPDNYDPYSGIEITILQPGYQWLTKHNNGDVIPMHHAYMGDVMAHLEISERPFSSFFSRYVPYIERYWGTDRLTIKGHTFESLYELLNSKVKSLDMIYKARKKSLKRTGHFFSSSNLKDLEGNQVPFYNVPVWVTGFDNKEHPILIAESKIKELMTPVYEDAEKNLKGIVVPYYFESGATTDLKLKNVELSIIGGPLYLEVKLIFHFYKSKEGSYGTHRTYSVINEVIDFKKSINI